ncbi:MAG: hypothetical protein ACO3UM_18325, partial [Planctomycetota bacterium]
DPRRGRVPRAGGGHVNGPQQVNSHDTSVGFSRWVLRTVVGGTVLGLLMFVVYVLVAMFR